MSKGLRYQYEVVYGAGIDKDNEDLRKSLLKVGAVTQVQNPCPLLRIRPCLGLDDMFLFYKCDTVGEFKEIFLARFFADGRPVFVCLLYKVKSLLELLKEHGYGS